MKAEKKKPDKNTPKSPDDKKSTIKPILIKLLVFIILAIMFISLLVSRDSIFTDYKKLDNLRLWDLFSRDGPELSNPLGICGAWIAHWIVYIFGKWFSIVVLGLILVNMVIHLAYMRVKALDRFSLFLTGIAFNLNLLFFYFQSFFTDSYLPPPKDKVVFLYIYNFFSTLLGATGTFLLCIILTFLSFRLIFPFNPFRLLVNGFIRLKKAIVKKLAEDEEDIEEEEDEEEIELEPAPPNPVIETPQQEDYNITLSTDNTEVPQIAFKPRPKTPPPPDDKEDATYQKPDIDSFLYKPTASQRVDMAKLQEEIKQISKVLKDKLGEFDIDANVLNVNVGPIITQYELDPAPGIKVSRFTSLSDDLALALKARSIRVQAPIPGRGLIGVEIPNKNADIIYMRDIFFSPEMANSEAILSVALGKDIAGRPIVTDLAKTPHLLIAGATGAGKSVCINTIICSLLLRCTPDEVRLVMIDPKRIELSGYDDIPHLIQNVVTEPEDALNALNWAVYEMERRYELLQELKVRDIITYNQKINEMLKIDEAEEIDRLPYIVVIVDEFADLIMTAGKEIELPITRLAQMARAVGIHLILATQRPSTKVITGVIKANFPARIAFRVSSQIDSRVILDTNGAEKLLGRGDMLFLPPGKPNPERIHGAYLSDSEIEGLVEYLRTQPKPKLQIQMQKPESVNIDQFEYDDDLFPEATRVVVSSNMASVSMLQRHFKIGYARAGRLIDLLEQAGVIGPHLGSKSREVLMTKDDLKN